jgi:hypothetical protein
MKKNYKKPKKNFNQISTLMTPQEAYDYYVKKHPVLLIWIVFILILTTLTLIVWDGSIPVSSGLSTILDK